MGKSEDCSTCAKCIEYIHLMLDGESNSDQDEFVRSHLTNCSSCLNEYEVEKQVRYMLKVKLSPINTPKTLADKLKAKIRSGNY